MEEDMGHERASTVVPLKSDSLWRWAVLALSCIAMVGNYYCFDNPAALKSNLDETIGLSESEYNLLYTVYSIPNIVLPFFGGYLCDMLGAPLAFLLFAVAITAGQCVFAFGVSIKSLGLMYVGRIMFGLGGENMSVGSSVILEEWFRNKEMALAMGLNVAVSRIGSVVNNIVSPAIANSSNVAVALWVGAMICGVSVGCAMLIFPIDRAGEARVNRMSVDNKLNFLQGDQDALIVKYNDPEEIEHDFPAESSRARSISHALPEDQNPPEGESLSCKQVAKFRLPFWLLAFCCLVTYGCVIPFNSVASSLLMERNYFMPQSSNKCDLLNTTECQSSTNVPNSYCDTGHWYQPPLPDIKGYGEDDIDCSQSKYKSGCTKDYCDGEKKGQAQASYIMSIPYILSACLSPILGGVVDKVGGRAVVCFVSASTLVLVHTLMGFATGLTPVIPMIGQGIAYSMFAAALWPSVPYLVPKESIGLAYGVVTAVQNAGLAAIPELVAVVYESSDDSYIPNVEVLFLSFAALGGLSALALNCVEPRLNKRHPGPYVDPYDEMLPALAREDLDYTAMGDEDD